MAQSKLDPGLHVVVPETGGETLIPQLELITIATSDVGLEDAVVISNAN